MEESRGLPFSLSVNFWYESCQPPTELQGLFFALEVMSVQRALVGNKEELMGRLLERMRPPKPSGVREPQEESTGEDDDEDAGDDEDDVFVTKRKENGQ